jgi:drug/metabolite transporter (DMT)-like permease
MQVGRQPQTFHLLPHLLVRCLAKCDPLLVMSVAHRHRQIGLVLVVAAAVAWSTSGLFTRALTVNTAAILFWRGLFGALGMLLVLALIPASGGLTTLRTLGRWGLVYAAITALSMLFFVSALRHTSVAHVAIITAAVPLMAGWLGWLVLRERPGPSAILASLAALAGVALMVGVSKDGALLGDGLAIWMALTMAVMILISRRHPLIPALAATCVASALSAIVVLPFVTLTATTGQELVVLALFGLVNQVLGFGLFALGARWLPPTETALITALDAPLAPFWVWLVFGETPGTATMIGGIIVMVAVATHLGWQQRHA